MRATRTKQLNATKPLGWVGRDTIPRCVSGTVGDRRRRRGCPGLLRRAGVAGRRTEELGFQMLQVEHVAGRRRAATAAGERIRSPSRRTATSGRCATAAWRPCPPAPSARLNNAELAFLDAALDYMAARCRRAPAATSRPLSPPGRRPGKTIM